MTWKVLRQSVPDSTCNAKFDPKVRNFFYPRVPMYFIQESYSLLIISQSINDILTMMTKSKVVSDVSTKTELQEGFFWFI